MVTIHTNGNKISYDIQHFILDTEKDLKTFNKNLRSIGTGSTVFIIENSKYYMLNSKKEWIEITYSSNNGSGDSGGDSGSDDNIYDGGSIDGSDPA